MIPVWLARALIVAGVLTDLGIVVAGVYAVALTPPSIAITTTYRAAALVWAVLLIGGGTASLIGSLTRRVRVVAGGITASAGGMGVWALAAVTQPDATLTAYGTAAAFWSLSAALVWRLLGVIAGMELRRAGLGAHR